MRLRVVFAAVAVVATVSVVASACTSPSAGPPVSLPVPKTGEVTFYLSLPASTTGLSDAAAKVATPGSSNYRQFSSLATAARQFGATDAQINTIAKSVETLGLQFTADPTRLFGRATGSTKQWQAALGTPLTVQAATATNPFISYGLPSQTPAALQPSGTGLLLRRAEVYDPGAEGRRPPSRPGPAAAGGTAAAASQPNAAEPWPLNSGTPFTAGCSAPPLQQGQVYTEQQIQTAYGVDTLRTRASGTPVITVLDLGGGWLPSDLTLAGQCFGYTPPQVDQIQGDGIVTAIGNADPETSLDLQTAAAVAPGAQLRLVQSTAAGGGILDGFSRALGGPSGLPDVVSLSYGGCAIEENTADPAFTSVVDAVLAMAALTGVSTFVAAGDSGSTTCGTNVSGTSLSYPAVSPFVTAVGGSRLTLGTGDTRVSETVWNDSVYGASAAGGGALSRRESRPAYQNGFIPQNHRAVPDVSALADIVPGWPDVTDSALQPVGGTSGSTPLIAAATALVDGSERTAGRPRVGLANGWFYRAAAKPGRFFDITTGSNDLAGVGCCPATAGYDFASGLGVPNWAVLSAALPKPG
ncbi:MAG: kumamolisin [Pseudonocardiales bacterium]|nr:kumamolisin [Pseudonocardiales bacterium]